MNILSDKEACYNLLKTHDPRFDGKIYVAVKTTGIYCRPVCRVKAPKVENCLFFSSAASAEAAGFRPCLKCRPELAPETGNISLAGKAASLIEEEYLQDETLAELADRLVISDRHLRRIFAKEFGVSPVKYLQSRRLLMAKRLLTDTALPVTQIAFISGFGSIRQFNSSFKNSYKLSPTTLRKQQTAKGGNDSILLKLSYRPPYNWASILGFLKLRAIQNVEYVDGGAYMRTISIGKYSGWIRVINDGDKNMLIVSVSHGLIPAIAPLMAKLRHLFDLEAEPAEIAERLGGLEKYDAGTRVPGCVSGFEIAVRAVLGQQITVKAACTLAGRFATAFGMPIETPYAGLTHCFPDFTHIHNKVDAEAIGKLGIIRKRAECIKALAAALTGGAITLSPNADFEREQEKLLAIPGIGRWTADYIVMRALNWPDVFLYSDLGIKKALGGVDRKAMEALAGKWMPWRSYTVMHLWNTL